MKYVGREKQSACIPDKFGWKMCYNEATKKEGTGKKMLHWEPVHQEAFDSMKQLRACNPNFEFPCEIHTDASDYQLGDVIIQNNRPIALIFSIRKFVYASLTELSHTGRVQKIH